MPLNQKLITTLGHAIKKYCYPKVTYDFLLSKEISHSSMRQLETLIKNDLVSNNLTLVKNGLSNILYWGHYRAGYYWTRVKKFRKKVKNPCLQKASSVFQTPSMWSIENLKKRKLPEFSNLSFLSKLLMFLDPRQYVVLDKKLMRLKQIYPFNKISEQKTYIPCTEQNIVGYREWCCLCKTCADKYFQHQKVFAVDIERGIFYLVENARYSIAENIIKNI